MTGILTGSEAVSGTTFRTGVGSSEDGGGAGAEKCQPTGAKLLSTQKHHIGRPLLGVDAEHVVNKLREKSRTVRAVGELRSTEVGDMEETLNGVEGMVPGDCERGGFRNRLKRCLEIRQVRDLLEVVDNIDDAICVS